MISEPQTFWKSHNWTFLLHEFFFFSFSFAWISSLGIFPCMNFFFGFPPPPPENNKGSQEASLFFTGSCWWSSKYLIAGCNRRQLRSVWNSHDCFICHLRVKNVATGSTIQLQSISGNFWHLEAEVEFDRKSVLTIGACLMKKENADSKWQQQWR